MKDIAVSIIVPVYNVEQYLKKCLDSLVNQTLENIEIIAVNDASPDNCLSILKEYKESYPDKFSYIDSPINLRQGGAKNLGIEAARGKYIAFVDSDDWVDLDMYRQLYEKAVTSNSEIVDADFFRVEDGKLYSRISNSNDQICILDNVKRRSLILNSGYMWTKIYLKKLWLDNNIRFPEHTFFEDFEIALLPLMYANKLEKINKPLYYYYIRKSSTMHDIDSYSDRLLTSINAMLHLKERNFYNIYKEEIDFRIIGSYASLLPDYLFNSKKLPLNEMRQMRKTVKQIMPFYKKNKYYKTKIQLKNRILIKFNSLSPILLLFLICGYHFLKVIFRKSIFIYLLYLFTILYE